ncbi:Pisatin demethylase [Botryosphaeria dothidea]|uniref:Pisatin demethylase n=1 Tax=Botryosphaeria dothidea TaxID=55169 RepID=A0A8H4IVG6_9PEZI|nr:Pisatin demethylase [Botryosphaeria dothidea]
MLLNEVLPFLIRYWPAVIASVVVIHLLRNKFNKGLNKYPGPALAGYTNWWRFFDVWGRKTEWTHIHLHRKHGDFVRLGPNVISIADPKAIKMIYGLNKGMTKSDFYPLQQATANGQRVWSLFTSQNEDWHAKYRRCVNGAFAMSALVSYEPLVDSTVNFFLDQTDRLFASSEQVCNFNRWLQFFAFDVIGDLTWSKRLGYIEKNEDIDNIVAFLAKFLGYCAVAGQQPWLDLLIDKNPIKLALQRWGVIGKIFPVTKFALERQSERAAEMEKIRNHGLDDNKGGAIDLLSKFTGALHDHPEFMTERMVLASSVSMIFAGSETTGISLSAAFYYLVKNPRVYKKLMEELDEAVRNGTIVDRENGAVTWAEAQKLPYLDAVVQETFRVHPAAGLMLERVTPPQGITVCGEFIPGGTIVGCNAWVLHRRPEIFGQDADVYRPERWLEASPEKLKEMKATMFQFGGGSRTCLGKNISLLEIYKLVPSFLRRFEIELEHPDQDWKTQNHWFVRQVEFNTKFRPRPLHATV